VKEKNTVSNQIFQSYILELHAMSRCRRLHKQNLLGTSAMSTSKAAYKPRVRLRSDSSQN
jgi:hypothetical protein